MVTIRLPLKSEEPASLKGEHTLPATSLPSLFTINIGIYPEPILARCNAFVLLNRGKVIGFSITDKIVIHIPDFFQTIKTKKTGRDTFCRFD